MKFLFEISVHKYIFDCKTEFFIFDPKYWFKIDLWPIFRQPGHLKVCTYLCPSSSTFWIGDDPNVIWFDFKIVDFLSYVFKFLGHPESWRIDWNNTIVQLLGAKKSFNSFVSVVRFRYPSRRSWGSHVFTVMQQFLLSFEVNVAKNCHMWTVYKDIIVQSNTLMWRLRDYDLYIRLVRICDYCSFSNSANPSKVTVNSKGRSKKSCNLTVIHWKPFLSRFLLFSLLDLVDGRSEHWTGQWCWWQCWKKQ